MKELALVFLVLILCGCSRINTNKAEEATVRVVTGNHMGTGVIDGQRVITCAHIVKDTTNQVLVILGDTEAIVCEIDYINYHNDIAILKPTKLLPDIHWKRTQVRVQDKIWSCGDTFGFDRLIVHGYVIGLYDGVDGDRILAAIPVEHGSSGSPVFKNGKLVGIVSAMASSTHAVIIPSYLIPP